MTQSKEHNALPKTKTIDPMTEINNELFFLTLNATMFFHEHGARVDPDNLGKDLVEHLMAATAVLCKIRGLPDPRKTHGDVELEAIHGQ